MRSAQNMMDHKSTAIEMLRAAASCGPLLALTVRKWTNIVLAIGPWGFSLLVGTLVRGMNKCQKSSCSCAAWQQCKRSRLNRLYVLARFPKGLILPFNFPISGNAEFGSNTSQDSQSICLGTSRRAHINRCSAYCRSAVVC